MTPQQARARHLARVAANAARRGDHAGARIATGRLIVTLRPSGAIATWQRDEAGVLHLTDYNSDAVPFPEREA